MISKIQKNTKIKQIFKQKKLFIPIQFKYKFKNLQINTPKITKYILNKITK